MLPTKIFRSIDFRRPKKYQQAMLEAWKKFTSSRQLDSIVPPVIAASWRRCWGRVNPNTSLEFTRMSAEYLLASQTASFDLIAIARPVMEDVYQCIQTSGTIILLTNPIGCVLDWVGDADITGIMEDWGAGIGSILAEEQIGTSSIGLALAERMPVQVAGWEHFVSQFHLTTGAAAPIFDISGRLLGVIGILMPVDRYHVHSLGMIVAAARAIESQRQSDQLLMEQNSQLAELDAVISTISDGIMVWSADYVLVHANQAAGEILGIPLKSMAGKPAEFLFPIPSFVNRSVLRRKPLVDSEASINVAGRTVNCLISLDFVFKRPGELQWIIVTLRPEKKVRKLVQYQVGANAALTLDDIPGDSPQMLRVRGLVESVAGGQASVLIRGEGGTGKNALASALHNAGPHADGPFIIFSCASIPNELALRELLGYEEGVDEKRSGGQPSKFELAEGGTLYFQDVDALPMEAQVALLNALELGVVQRLGSRRTLEVNARVIASTVANMEKLIAQGSFRPDLYYRLSIFTIPLPPLRERPRDIPKIAERILTRFSKQFGYRVSLDPEVMEVFKKYSWPGNIREMEAVLGRAATQVNETGPIRLNQIPDSVRRMEAALQNVRPFLQVSSLLEMERETILLTAQIQQGNVSRMAQALGVSRTTLWRKLKSYGIDPEEYRQRV